MSRPHDQLNLPATPLRNLSEPDPARKSSESDVIEAASYLFDRALTQAGLTTGEAAHLMGVSESMAHKMRSANYRECVSLVQLLRCGPLVVWHFHRALHAKHKFAQLALRDTMQALSLLAVGLE